MYYLLYISRIMKTQIKNSIIAVFLGSILIACLPSCEKDAVKQEFSSVKDLKLEKIEKIRGFMAWGFKISSDKITFDEKSDSFLYPEGKYTFDEMESIYDKSNEYKKAQEKK